MKITITQDFDTAEEALAFLARLAPAESDDRFVIVSPVAEISSPETPTEKRARKPRADAGKARGPYKTTGGPSTSEPDKGGNSVPTPPAVTVSPTQSAAPVKSPAVESSRVEPAPVAAGTALTLEEIRETLGTLHKAPGKGTVACIAALQKFGVNRISDLPQAKYAEFDVYVRAQLPTPGVG